MTKEKLYMLISFLLQMIIGLVIYAQKQDIASVRQEIAWTRELLEVKISNKHSSHVLPEKE